MPKTMPTATETPKAMITEMGVTMVCHWAVLAISQERKKPKATPSRPPAVEISTDSVRNWRIISARRAPVVRRIPICGWVDIVVRCGNDTRASRIARRGRDRE
jgi:hypothetical protein